MPAINKHNGFYTSKKISEQINQKYQHIKYFTNSNYFYYHDNDIPIYYPEINSLFDKDFFNRNKEIKFFLFKGSEDNFSQYVTKGRFDFKNNIATKKSKQKNTNPTCLNSEYELLESWNFNYRRFFLFPEIEKLGLYRLC